MVINFDDESIRRVLGYNGRMLFVVWFIIIILYVKLIIWLVIVGRMFKRVGELIGIFELLIINKNCV